MNPPVVSTESPTVAPATAAEKKPRPHVDVSPRVIELFGDPHKAPETIGTDYLPEETLERAKKGSFLEKVGR